MLRMIMLVGVALGLVACGSPAPRDRCSSDAACGTGSYCASGGVCWPDATPPVLADVTVTCATPCLRDSTLEVTARASDDGRVAAVTARLDLAPGQVVPMALQGGIWRASLALGSWPFAAFERAVEVTVEAQDGAGNGVSAARSAGMVSRLRWEVELAPGAAPIPVPGAVAVDGQGTAILGASDARVYFIGSDGAARRPAAAVGAGAIAAPVVVGATGVWVPSDDGKVYRVPSDAAAGVEMVCDTGAAVRGVALDASGQPLAASATGAFFSSVGGVCRNSTIYAGDVLYAPVASGSRFFGAEGNSLHAFVFNGTGFPVDEWTSPANTVGAATPLAIRNNGEVVALTSPSTGGGSLLSISPTGTPTTLATTDVPSDGPVVLASGDIVVPEKGKTLSAWSATGTFRWRSPALPGAPLTPLVLAGGPDQLLVADARGNLTALDAAGQLRWTTQLAPAAIPLRPPNLVALPGGDRSLGYFPAANGKLYAVILDGRLDGAAPWPKAFHDPRNTGNVATPLPTP
jgi:outer membrane protein assembly factor BamB